MGLFDAMITKPFDPDALHKTITNHVSIKKADISTRNHDKEAHDRHRVDFQNIKEQFIREDKIQALYGKALKA